MKHKYIAGLLLSVSLGLIVIGYAIFHPELFGFCADKYNCFSESTTFGIGLPLYKSIYLLPILFLGLMFVNKEVFWGWVKFITLFVIFGVYLIVITDPFPRIPWPDRTSLTESIVRIWFGLSILFIAGKYLWINRKNAK